MSPRRAAVALAFALAIVPAPVLAAEPRTGTAPATATRPDATRPFSLVLHRATDLVAQTNFVQCVGASMQTMLNILDPGTDRTAETQLRLQQLARKWSGPRPDGITRKGASVRGWATGLTLLGAGPYKLVGEETLDEAVRTAALAIRRTGKPVGLLMWRGRHAWVMTGFRSTIDPLLSSGFRITGVNVFDPLYPHGSSLWGASPRPGSAITVQALGKQFRPRRSRFSNSVWATIDPTQAKLRGKYVLVLPYLPRAMMPGDPRSL
jgi:hypothetical protein